MKTVELRKNMKTVELTNLEINKKEKVVKINGEKVARPETIVMFWDGGGLIVEVYTDDELTVYTYGSIFRKNRKNYNESLFDYLREFRYVINNAIKPILKTIFHIINAHFS